LTYVVSKVETLHTKYLLAKNMGLLLLSCSFPLCLFGFALFCSLLLSSCFLLVHFLFIYGFLIFLQQSICIAFISCVVKFALSSCLLLSSCCLLVHFPCCCLDFRLFCFSKHFFATIYLFIEHRY